MTRLKRSPLHEMNASFGAIFGAFAGYDMPMRFPAGILAEHRWVREKAGLFDVSHMGPAMLRVSADADGRKAAASLERLLCSDIAGLAPGQARYTLLLGSDGGIRDDLVVSRLAADDAHSFYLVANAGRKEDDFADLARECPDLLLTRADDDHGLIALQGPLARSVFVRIAPKAADMTFMSVAWMDVLGVPSLVSCSGYTGEDGFEILAPADAIGTLAARLLDDEDVRPIGLGARDSLRLEAGLCLYGQDMDENMSPVAASLAWCLPRTRRQRRDFPGAERIMSEIKTGPPRKRVGLRLTGKTPARSGARIIDASGEETGHVTSGGPAPCLGVPVAMGYVRTSCAAPGTHLQVMIRDRAHAAVIVPMPFIPAKYRK